MLVFGGSSVFEDKRCRSPPSIARRLRRFPASRAAHPSIATGTRSGPAPSTPASPGAAFPVRKALNCSPAIPAFRSARSPPCAPSAPTCGQPALNLELQSARDLHSICKHSGPLNFSVGFRLEDFTVVEEKNLKPGEPWLIIKRGDLTEVSIVTFPACETATMDAKSKSMPPAFAKAMAEMQRIKAALGGEPVDRLAQLQAEQAAILSKIAALRQAIRKRQRDEETLRQWRHWSDERKRSLPARLNLI